MSDPNNPYGDGNDNPYGQPPSYGQTPSYGQQDPYGQAPSYGQQPEQSNPYGQPNAYGQQPYAGGFGPAPHPQAQTVLILGILSIVCLQILGPFAWIMGNKTVKEIDANPGAYTGRENANIGRILGIIGTVFLIIGILVIIFYVILIVGLVATEMESSTTYSY